MTRETYYQRHKDVILKEQKDYYENDKKKWLREQAKTKYRELPEEEKNIEVIWKKQIS